MADEKKPTKRYFVVNHAPGARGFSTGATGEPIMLPAHGGEAEVELTDQEFERLSRHPDLRLRPAEDVKRERATAAKEQAAADEKAAAKAAADAEAVRSKAVVR